MSLLMITFLIMYGGGRDAHLRSVIYQSQEMTSSAVPYALRDIGLGVIYHPAIAQIGNTLLNSGSAIEAYYMQKALYRVTGLSYTSVYNASSVFAIGILKRSYKRFLHTDENGNILGNIDFCWYEMYFNISKVYLIGDMFLSGGATFQISAPYDFSLDRGGEGDSGYYMELLLVPIAWIPFTIMYTPVQYHLSSGVGLGLSDITGIDLPLSFKEIGVFFDFPGIIAKYRGEKVNVNPNPLASLSIVSGSSLISISYMKSKITSGEFTISFTSNVTRNGFYFGIFNKFYTYPLQNNGIKLKVGLKRETIGFGVIAGLDEIVKTPYFGSNIMLKF